jgi:NAD(P)H-dependent FMN reductase
LASELGCEQRNIADGPKWAAENPKRVIMIVPEWNGSFPFTFKQMIDESGYPSFFSGMGFAIVGTSSSPLGNMVGISHLSHILQFVGALPFHKCIALPDVSSESPKLANFASYSGQTLAESLKKSFLG